MGKSARSLRMSEKRMLSRILEPKKTGNKWNMEGTAS
jgi:hypothetical protein